MDIAKWMIALVAIYNFGGYAYDVAMPRTARMHIYNPAWRPHAKFHNAQGILMGMALGTLAIVILFAFRPLTLPIFLIAAAVAGIYFFAMILSPLFHDTVWVDPEFQEFVPKRLGLWPNQLVAYILCTVWVAAVVIACVLR